MPIAAKITIGAHQLYSEISLAFVLASLPPLPSVLTVRLELLLALDDPLFSRGDCDRDKGGCNVCPPVSLGNGVNGLLRENCESDLVRVIEIDDD